MNRFYVYRILFKDTVVYIGKGTGDRISSEKNGWFNLFDAHLHFEREKVACSLTSDEALAVESKLIDEYNPVFNKVKGLSPKKWVDLSHLQIQAHIRNARDGDLATPVEVQQVVEQYVRQLGSTGRVLYPCAGCGSLLPVSHGATAVEVSEQNAATLLRHRGLAVICDDFLTWKTDMQFDLIIMNPPFTLGADVNYWKQFVTKALSLLSPTGKLVAVLPQHGNTKSLAWEQVLLSDVTFDNAAGTVGMVVVHSGEMPGSTRIKAAPVSGKDFAPYGVSVKMVPLKKGESSQKLVGRAVYWERAAPGKAVVADAWCGKAGEIKMVTGPDYLLEALVSKLQAQGAFNANIQNGTLLELVKQCTT